MDWSLRIFPVPRVLIDTTPELTDGDMMDPEASVSALVFHHPEAKYFRTDVP